MLIFFIRTLPDPAERYRVFFSGLVGKFDPFFLHILLVKHKLC
jgi:hypothetical protein